MLKYTITQKNRARGDRTWYGRIFDPVTKKVSFVSLSTELKYVAEEWLNTRIAEEMTGKKDTSHITVDRALNEFLRTYETRTGYANYVNTFSHLRVFCAEMGIRRLTDVSSAVMLNFFAMKTNLKASTRRRMRTMYKTWWKWCCRVYEIRGVDNPLDIVKIEKPDPPDRSFWTPDQIARILDAIARPEDRLLVAFMAYEGLRIHEAMKVKGSDMHDGKLFVLGKGKKFASIPIGEKMRAELDRFGRVPQGRLFPQIALCSWDQKIKRLFDSHPELDFGGKAHPHRFRHSFASNLIRAGVNIKAVQLLMRHENVNITLNTYAHLIPSDLESAINKI